MESSGKLPLAILMAHARAHKESSLLPDSCVPSSVGFTHHTDQTTWLSGLTFSAHANRILEGAKDIAERYGEKEEVVKINLKDVQTASSFILSHEKIWVITFGARPEDGHMFSAVRDSRNSQKDYFFVWDTSPVKEQEGKDFQLPVEKIVDRIRHHSRESEFYYLIGFNPIQS